MPAARVLIVGLDGATFSLLQPWIDAGHLPTLARLQGEGASGLLESTFPPISAAAWSSFATGVNPGKYGVVDFYYPRPGQYVVNTMSAAARTARPVWELLGEAGLLLFLVGFLAELVVSQSEQVDKIARELEELRRRQAGGG